MTPFKEIFWALSNEISINSDKANVGKCLSHAISCPLEEPTAESTSHKQDCDPSVYEKLKLKDSETVHFVHSDRPPDDVVADVTTHLLYPKRKEVASQIQRRISTQ